MLLKLFLILFFVDGIVNKCLLNIQPAKVCKFFQLSVQCDPEILDEMEKICEISKVTRNEKKCPTYNCFKQTVQENSQFTTAHTPTNPITTYTTQNPALTTLTLEHTLLTPTTPFTRIETTTETATTTYLSNTFLATLEQSSTISSEQSQSEVFVSEALEVKEKRTNQDDSLETLLSEKLQPTETNFQEKVVSNELLEFSRMSSAEIDCDQKTCFLEYHFQKVCSVVSNNGAENCNVPCVLTSCNYELHKNINCPIWTCVPLPAPFTTSVPPVTTTMSPDKSHQNEIIMIISLIVNVILFLAFSIVIFYKVKSFRRRRHYTDPEQEFLETQNESVQPIIRSRSQRLPDSFGMINFEVSLNEPTPDLEENSSAILTLNSPEPSSTEASSTFKKFEKFEEKKNKHRNRIV